LRLTSDTINSTHYPAQLIIIYLGTILINIIYLAHSCWLWLSPWGCQWVYSLYQYSCLQCGHLQLCPGLWAPRGDRGPSIHWSRVWRGQHLGRRITTLPRLPLH